ncbi:hypothetical protein Ocin01_15085 [Orchesella cincta]|uniref:Uncharacterized protein n=1 Tax=Orchesella cincta TaxID=48709 RepID=A0A1D2MF32_ORCCI|nr:hypothetical protein Ocin01_15085 [Orchesella cincta]
MKHSKNRNQKLGKPYHEVTGSEKCELLGRIRECPDKAKQDEDEDANSVEVVIKSEWRVLQEENLDDEDEGME